jgi:hypothetical protein
MGAITFVESADGQSVIDNKRVVKGRITFSSSYATGGDTLDLASEVGLNQVDKMMIDSNSAGVLNGYGFALSGTAKAPKVVIWSAALTELANGTNTAAVVLDVWLFGT